MTDVIMCYATFKDEVEAKKIVTQLVGEGLIACGNLLSPIQSIYKWKGVIENTEEIAALLKTTKSKLETLKARFAALHSYDTPCLLVIKVKDGLEDYIQWLKNELPE